ncbi:MAG: PD40 domain-containing protein [Planctomycetia bacterium]|nr:PD40 domain-containing protein [Planctomycetia bacterium]
MIPSLFSIVSTETGGWCGRLVFSQTMIWLAAACAAWMLRRSSAAVRHRVWALSVLAALALPITISIVPALRLGWIETRTALLPSDATQTIARVIPAGAAPEFDLSGGFADVDAARSSGPEHATAADKAVRGLSRDRVQADRHHAEAWGAWLVFIIPVVWGLWRIARALLAARRIIAASLPIDEQEVFQICSSLADNLGWRGAVGLRQSEQTRVPLCLGWKQPRIVLPADWRRWPAETLRAVIAHEMSHVVRQDVAWQLLARLACALYWFQPLAWLAAWRMRVEREYACDDSVLCVGEKPTAYARVLVDVAGRLIAGTSVSGAAAAMVVQSGLERRVLAILTANRPRRPLGRRAGQALLLATLFAFVSASTVSPFSNTIQKARAAGSQDAAEPEFAGDETPHAATPAAAAGPANPEPAAKPAKNDSPARARLFIASSDGSGMKPLDVLPEYGYQGSPKWSPDGKRIAFNVWKEGEDHTSGQIALFDANGGNARVLIDGLMPSFSPRGDRLVFSRPGSDHGVWVMNIEGPARNLVQIDESGWGADWSPDGKLVYSISTAGGANLAVFDFADKRRLLLLDEQQSPYKNVFWSMAWSPDGRRIAFKGLTTNDKYEVGFVDARGETLGRIHRIEGEVMATFAWSPDGSRVLFCKPSPQRGYRSQMYLLDPDSNDPPQLLAGQDPRLHYVDVAWSPDGKKIVASAMQPATKARAEQANISPEMLKARFVANFRGQQPDANVKRLISNANPSYASLNAEGLRLHLPAGEEKPDRAGISAKFEIRGDFELIAVFHSLAAHKPAEGWGAGLHLLLQLGTGPKDYILVERMLSGAGQSVFATKHGHVDLDGQYHWKIAHHPPNEIAAGKIKIVRKGSVVYYLFAEYGTDEYNLFDEKVITDADVQLLKLEACAKDRQAGSDLILDELEIRAEELPGIVK